MEKWQNPDTITLWIVIAVVLLIILLVFITLLIRVLFLKMIKTKIAEAQTKLEHQQNLIDATIKAQEKERKRIAADLHDELISKLTVLKMTEHPRENYNETGNLVNDCISIARRISHDLSPPLLEYTPLPELIIESLRPWKNIFEIDYCPRILHNYEYDSDFKIQLLRIIQEVITNISKHAKAQKISFYYRQSQQQLIIKIKDNGIGFDRSIKQKGLGLQNIETRVQYLNGNFRISSKLNEGTSSFFIFKNISE